MNRSIFSKLNFRHRKGVPDIPNRIRPVVSTDWTVEIERLEKFFAGVSIPVQPFQLNKWTNINDLRFCIQADLAYVKANIGMRSFHSCLEQLQEIKRKLLRYRKGEARKDEMLLRKIRLKNKRAMRISLRTIPDDDFVLEMTSKFTAKEQRLVNKNASPQKHFLLTFQH